MLPDFGDGVWFCELAAAADGAVLEQVIAGAVDAVPRPGLSLAESVIEFLRSRACCCSCSTTAST